MAARRRRLLLNATDRAILAARAQGGALNIH
jgi:hypothetical protein